MDCLFRSKVMGMGVRDAPSHSTRARHAAIRFGFRVRTAWLAIAQAPAGAVRASVHGRHWGARPLSLQVINRDKRCEGANPQWRAWRDARDCAAPSSAPEGSIPCSRVARTDCEHLCLPGKVCVNHFSRPVAAVDRSSTRLLNFDGCRGRGRSHPLQQKLRPPSLDSTAHGAGRTAGGRGAGPPSTQLLAAAPLAETRAPRARPAMPCCQGVPVPRFDSTAPLGNPR